MLFQAILGRFTQGLVCSVFGPVAMAVSVVLNNLCGAAVAKKQWGWILPEMDMVPAPGCGLPACGREHLPAESCLDT